MRKIIATCLLSAVMLMTFAPVFAGADTNGAAVIETGLIRGTGGGTIPEVIAKWEMSGHCMNAANMSDPLVNYVCNATTEGNDYDQVTPGAQFMPSGIWGTPVGDMNYTVCSIVTDPDGISDIQGVYADIYWPVDIAFHENPSYPDVHPDSAAWTSQSGSADIGLDGCGEFKEQNTLYALSKTNGYRLFCETIENTNDNLPTILGSYNYNLICDPDGVLMKETAKVYCDNKHLIWEDPAGAYKVEVMAQDKSGNSSILGVNHFDYLQMTSFEKDFTGVSYGTVMLNTHKSVSGDLTFSLEDLKPTIRNTGNTRLSMWVAQDDMGLGQSSGIWNVEFDGRVGNHEADWKVYSPFNYTGNTPTWDTNYTQLEDVLNLSEADEMDFSILVKKWPNTNTSYSGSMWLGAQFAPFRDCVD
ncbi:MAG: hypothetical protein WC309_03425 [Candidatus Paceibacterota bacterium]|jgi:hypothetical protein